MKVLCTQLPVSPLGEVLASNAWVTVGSKYHVVSILAEPARSVQLQIVTDDGRSLAWFSSTYFATVDETVPDRWVSRIGSGGVLALAPAALLAPGFWEAYYDGEPSAVEAMETEFRLLR